jgi:hypothetical protein
MLFNFLRGKTKVNQDESETIKVKKNRRDSIKRFSLAEQKELQSRRKRLVINEFGKSLINLQLENGIWTPLYVVDLVEVSLKDSSNFREKIPEELEHFFAVHKQNLRQKIYRESFNFNPSEILIVVKDSQGEFIVSYKNFAENVENLILRFETGRLNPSQHRLLFLRYFVPPVPEDLYKCDHIIVPPKFEEALREIVNYCDLNYSRDNLTREKLQKLISELNIFGMTLKFPDDEQSASLDELLTTDFSHIGYHRVKVVEEVKDTVEKNPVTIPLFILLLAFFCSDQSQTNSFLYHYLFTPTGKSKKTFLDRNEVSFQKLFNKLLDESLLPNQFRKCLSVIYYEAFMLHQYEIDDLLFEFREQYKQRL